MNKSKKIITRIKTYLLNFTLTQLAMILVSLPVLVGWGLGCSVMSFVGNLIFAPVLMVYLMLSSLLLFSEVVGIPNGFLAFLINAITACWDVVLGLGSSEWVIECARPPTLVLISIPILVFIILHHKLINNYQKRFLVMTCLIAGTYGICLLQKKQNMTTSLTNYFDTQLYIIKLVDSSSIIIVDNGFFSRKKSPDNVIDYELKPWVTKLYGKTQIKEIRLTKPSMGGFRAAQHMCTIWNTEAVWVPFFKIKLNKKTWQAYVDLKNFLDKNSIRLVRYQNLTACQQK